MKHFLDLGTNRFQGLNEFTRRLEMDETWSIHCFEPNPYVYKDAVQICREKNIQARYANFSFECVAISNITGFAMMDCIVAGKSWQNSSQEIRSDFGGSSISKRRDNRFKNDLKSIQKKVKTRDVEEILHKIVQKDGNNVEIFIKCDIEGEEFKVIPRILSSAYLGNIAEIHIEWHTRFFPHEEKEIEKIDLIEKLKASKIQVFTHR